MGFLPGSTGAAYSDAFALIEIALACVLLAGMFIVRRGNVRLHRTVQSTVILGNLPIVLAWMLPRYLSSVLPDLPGELGAPAYLLPTVMFALGASAEILGIYIVLVAGTGWIPERYRFRRYKLWMRTELVLWWSVVVTGLSTYYLWYYLGGLS
ncbi:MAG: hypothetical protein L3K09_01500 [Thermoplasmata archaeon]|nr:hypothetical protein [Thermoplasmata archaeon]